LNARSSLPNKGKLLTFTGLDLDD